MELVLKMTVWDRDYMFLERLVRACLVLVMTCMLYFGMQNYDYEVSMMAKPRGSVGTCRMKGGAAGIDADDINGHASTLTENPFGVSISDGKSGIKDSLIIADGEENAPGSGLAIKRELPEAIETGEMAEVPKIVDTLEFTIMPEITGTSESLDKTVSKSKEQNMTAITVPAVTDTSYEEKKDSKSNENNENTETGLRELSGFMIDDAGFIVGFTDSIDVTDGLLVLPIDTECVGIRKGVFSGLGDDVMEMYIPANIVEIEAGALDDLPFLLYIEAAEDNPCYESIDGILYSRSGEEIFCPLGR